MAGNDYRLTYHAALRMAERKVLEEEVTGTIARGEVIERYPNDQPFPKCLFMYQIRPGQPLDVSCAYNEERQQAHIVTIHWFDPNKWLDWRRRRR